jgi:cell division septal protein FtsQ
MAERRVVRPVGRPQYGRPTPPPKRRRTLRVGPTTGGVVKGLPWRLISLIGGIVIVLWVVWSLFNVHSVVVTTPTKNDNVKSEVQTLLTKSFTQDNLLTLDTGKLTTDLITLDPQLKAVTISRLWPHGVQVVVTQKQPALGWSTGNQNYLLDRDGTVIGSLPSGSTLQVVVDGSNLPVQKGQQVVTASFVTFCNELLADLPSTGLKATGLRVQDTTFDLYVQTNKNYQLIFDTTRPAADEVADLKTVLATLAGKVPSQYIDMRISGKAYYQ